MQKIDRLKRIMEKSDSNKIIILTNHYKISGTVYECEECNKEEFINLTNVSLCKFEDSYTCECDDFGGAKYDWLHINLDKVVAFSFIQ